MIQHMDLRQVEAPGDAARAQLLESFAATVSLVECAERLQEWGAAPEQRLALWFRRLPSSGGDDGGYAEANVRLVTVVPHTASWELRAGLLHATVSRAGAPEGGGAGARGAGLYVGARRESKCATRTLLAADSFHRHPTHHAHPPRVRTCNLSGLIVLSDDMASSMIKGLPESLLLVKS